MYFPKSDSWETVEPGDAGFDPGRFAEAMNAAALLDLGVSRDLREMMPDGTRHPNDRPLGPLKDRGLVNGLVLRHGYIVGEFGDTLAPDVTFSATKSYISAVAGLAQLDGLIDDLDAPVAETVADGGFEGHNATITWRHLLQQTSEWEGELFGIPDWIDRGRQVSGRAAEAESRVGGSAGLAESRRSLEFPGTFWEYNDVRVNRTALALLRLYGHALPVVLRQRLMDPIGASDTWQWHGYSTSGVDVEGQRIESVSGGAHWGGGMWVSTRDHARFGHLYLNRGRWDDRRILDGAWVDETVAPCALNASYGLMWWLNHEGSVSRAAGTAAFAARGAGGNVVFVDPETEVVIVLRWCRSARTAIDGFLSALKHES